MNFNDFKSGTKVKVTATFEGMVVAAHVRAASNYFLNDTQTISNAALASATDVVIETMRDELKPGDFFISDNDARTGEINNIWLATDDGYVTVKAALMPVRVGLHTTGMSLEYLNKNDYVKVDAKFVADNM